MVNFTVICVCDTQGQHAQAPAFACHTTYTASNLNPWPNGGLTGHHPIGWAVPDLWVQAWLPDTHL